MEKLKIGKLDSDVLKDLVIDKIRLTRPEVKTRAGIGEDCAVIDFGSYDCVISTDPITANASDIGRLAIHISCNDIASNGIEPLGITLAVMLPDGTTKDDVSLIMAQAADAAEHAGVEIIGGHTEVTAAVNQPIIVSTAFGRSAAGASQSAAAMKAGDVFLLTKTAGLEGTGILASDCRDRLTGVLTEAELEQAVALLDQVSVVREGIIAGRIGTAGMHDVTEGGVLGAVWEMCSIAGLGADIRAHDIPIDDQTRKICEHFSMNPLRLISSGCMLIAAQPDHVEKIIREVSASGIRVTEIGTVLEAGSGITVKSGAESFVAGPPGPDELYKVIGKS